MMRRNYVYAIAIVMMSLVIWLSYYLYVECRQVEYKNGTQVELPEEFWQEEIELSA